jgi:hypothetical protein
MTSVRIVYKKFAVAEKVISDKCDAILAQCARELRDELKKALDMGALPIQSDTHALADSLYVKTKHGSDYEAHLAAAAAAYMGNESQWRGAIRQTVTPDAYTAGHFAERVAPEEPLKVKQNASRAAVATMLAYGTFWQYGHHNQFTNREEHRPWMDQMAYDWAFKNMAQHFYGLLS